MLPHRAIWDGIDALARRHGLSASALAKLAGLDATAFNVSKRVSKDGRLRWPVPKSLPKVLIGQYLERIERRGKYLLLKMESGYLLIHLGMYHKQLP
mgnify:CR=1 FL=1